MIRLRHILDYCLNQYTHDGEALKMGRSISELFSKPVYVDSDQKMLVHRT